MEIYAAGTSVIVILCERVIMIKVVGMTQSVRMIRRRVGMRRQCVSMIAIRVRMIVDCVGMNYSMGMIHGVIVVRKVVGMLERKAMIMSEAVRMAWNVGFDQGEFAPTTIGANRV